MAKASSGGNKLVSVDPEELRFQFELKKRSLCDLKISNTTDKHVAFKVKTTTPKKYCVRPNTGVIQPKGSCIIKVTRQAQREYPPDMKCPDKFLLECTPVAPDADSEALPQNTFSKEPGKQLKVCKLKVVYIARINPGNSDDKQSSDPSSNDSSHANERCNQLEEKVHSCSTFHSRLLQLEEEVHFLCKHMTATVNEQWIQIQHLGQALVIANKEIETKRQVSRWSFLKNMSLRKPFRK